MVERLRRAQMDRGSAILAATVRRWTQQSVQQAVLAMRKHWNADYLASLEESLDAEGHALAELRRAKTNSAGRMLGIIMQRWQQSGMMRVLHAMMSKCGQRSGCSTNSFTTKRLSSGRSRRNTSTLLAKCFTIASE